MLCRWRGSHVGICVVSICLGLSVCNGTVGTLLVTRKISSSCLCKCACNICCELSGSNSAIDGCKSSLGGLQALFNINMRSVFEGESDLYIAEALLTSSNIACYEGTGRMRHRSTSK